MAAGIPARLTRAEARRFGLVVGGAFLALAGVAWWRGRPTTTGVLGTLGAALFLLGIVAPGALVPVRRAWMALAMAMSKVTTPIFLGIVYFGLFTPIGLLRRLVGRGPLHVPARDGTRWVVRDGSGHRPEDMEHQF